MPRATARRRALFFLASCVGLTACGRTEPAAPRASTAAVQKWDDAPPSVAVDPPFELPSVAVSGSATSGVIVLSAPPDPALVRRAVAAFFEAVAAESVPELERVMDSGARARASAKARPDPALSWWRRRFDLLDYRTLQTEVFFFPSTLEIHTSRERPAAASAGALPAVPRGDEVVVRVPIAGRSTSKLFGSEIVFLLKPDAREPDRYRIAELYEDFRLP